jgi:hypothetical protein
MRRILPCLVLAALALVAAAWPAAAQERAGHLVISASNPGLGGPQSPRLTVFINGERLGQWEIRGAEQSLYFRTPLEQYRLRVLYELPWLYNGSWDYQLTGEEKAASRLHVRFGQSRASGVLGRIDDMNAVRSLAKGGK